MYHKLLLANDIINPNPLNRPEFFGILQFVNDKIAVFDRRSLQTFQGRLDYLTAGKQYSVSHLEASRDGYSQEEINELMINIAAFYHLLMFEPKFPPDLKELGRDNRSLLSKYTSDKDRFSLAEFHLDLNQHLLDDGDYLDEVRRFRKGFYNGQPVDGGIYVGRLERSEGGEPSTDSKIASENASIEMKINALARAVGIDPVSGWLEYQPNLATTENTTILTSPSLPNIPSNTEHVELNQTLGGYLVQSAEATMDFDNKTHEYLSVLLLDSDYGIIKIIAEPSIHASANPGNSGWKIVFKAQLANTC